MLYIMGLQEGSQTALFHATVRAATHWNAPAAWVTVWATRVRGD